MTSHLPRHQLEELAAERDAPALRAHVEACGQCASRLQKLVAARTAFSARRAPADFARDVLARRPATRPRQRWLVASGLALAAALSLIWLQREPEAIRFKGRTLQVFVQRNGQPAALEDGAPLAAGDRLAFTYTLAEPRHLLLLSIDDTGAITRYFPTDSGDSRLAATRAQLPVGVELDAHRGQERLVALFSRDPLEEAGARHALRAALREAEARGVGIAGMGRVALPVEQASVWFRKP